MLELWRQINNACKQVGSAQCAGMAVPVDVTSVGACLPGWLGRANMLLSLIAKLALCWRMRSSPGCLAGLTWRQHTSVWPHCPHGIVTHQGA